jgi:PAS domain S-box-containing protein
MPEWIRRLLLPTQIETEDAHRLQRTLSTILRAFIALTIILIFCTIVLFPATTLRPVITLSLILLLTLIFWHLNRKGKVRLASVLFIGMLWTAAALLTITGGGIRIPAFIMFFLPALLAYLLLGQREGTGIIVLTVLTGTILLFAESRGLLPPLLPITSEWVWIAFTTVLIAAAWLFNVATRNLRHSLAHVRQQEELLQAVIRSTANGIFVIDGKGSVLAMNQRFREMWNLPEKWDVTPDEHTGLRMMSEQTDNPQAFLARSRELLNNFLIEATDFIEMKNGTVIQRHTHPYITNGVLAGRIYSYLDVTEQIRSEQALIFFSEFKSLITSISTEFINLPVDDIDSAIEQTLARIGPFVDVDRAFVTLISGAPTQVATRYYWANEGVEPLIFSQSLTEFEQTFPWLNARLRWFESVVVSRVDDMPPEAAREQETIRSAGIKSVLIVPMIHNNTLIGYMGYDCVRAEKIWSDDMVSLLRIVGEIFAHALERKRTEAALRASEEMFRSLSENSPVGISMVDDNFRFIYVNDQYCRILGYSPEEIIGQDFRMVVPEDNRAALEDNYRKRQQGEFVPARYETRLLHKDGSVVWCEASAKALRDSEGRMRTMGLIVDISDRKQAEARRLELVLEREKVELLRQFIANMTHDLKTPLSVIETSLYLLRRNSDPSRAAEKLNIIQEQTRILSEFIQNLLTISRLDYIPQLDFKPVQVDALLDTTLRQMRSRLESKNLRTQIKRHGHVPPVLGAEDELSRAFGNLLENAINYTPEGGAVTCELDQRDPYLVVTVTDTGIGIDRDDLPHIFERFYRAEEARSTLSTGSGLGLAIVKKVVDLHQGQIEIDSTPGQGTTFRVLLPVAPTAAASST